ncbi:DUF3300 domain-containing protein [Mesorhizobium sp. M1E.F.Ca.ET.063.01.1.1]|uniref:DUF3300 domain-containing protein n=1 Tax=Mesorhizobium sp. M1E.F.Ca.ET.063.01.1.1 TaxID=2496750 RepID=UPI000FCBA3F3|nr:DUF3300 domain-containing protein [Mesorhizobium sp. M1E.F.Ca.ET.063.01.1.1]RUW86133.1 DUF3300 domain-containing protein [Mesorhizobium sp. M1E.F.Ca.ET.063.01.1.1]
MTKFFCIQPAWLGFLGSRGRAGNNARPRLLRALLLALVISANTPFLAHAQEQSASVRTVQREPLNEPQMEVLVARIALYPDELVAAIAAASLHPLQIVQAQRYLDLVGTQPEAKPDKSWDGSIISLLNYPEIIRMMSEDLKWTQQMGDAVAYQQKDLLEAIQKLRRTAVAKGIIKSDDKNVIVQKRERVTITPAHADKIYIPVYRSEELYASTGGSEGVSYNSGSYSSYYDPTATYYAAYFTGAAWAAAIDWYEGETWSGYGSWGRDVEIKCNYCFNDRNFSGNISLNQVDWAKVDSSRISFDRSNLGRLDQNTLVRDLKADGSNSLTERAAGLNPHGGETPLSRSFPTVGGTRLENLKAGNPGVPGMPAAGPRMPGGNRVNSLPGMSQPGPRVGPHGRSLSGRGDIPHRHGPRALPGHQPRGIGPRRPGVVPPGSQFRPHGPQPRGLAGPPRFSAPPGVGRPPMPPPGGPPPF